MLSIRRKLMMLKRGTAPVVVLPSFTTPTTASATVRTFAASCTMTPGSNVTITRQGWCYSTSQNPTTADNVEVVTSGTTSMSTTIQWLKEHWYSGQDTTIHTEPDGTEWYHISHDNNPASYSLGINNWSDVSSQYISADKWLSTKYDRYIDKHEYLVVQIPTSGGTASKYRWTQPVSMCRSTYSQAAVAQITKNETSGYATWSSNYGGLYMSAVASVYQQNNGTFSQTWGRICTFKRYNSGTAGFDGVAVTSGSIDLYVRNDNVNFQLKDGTTYYIRAFAECSNGETVYSEQASATTLSISMASGLSASASNIAQTTATYSGSWTGNGNTQATNTIFTTDTSSGVVIVNSSSITAVNDTTNPVSLSKTGLTANTQYYMRFFVANEVGVTGTSSVGVKTLANLTPPIITNVTFGSWYNSSGNFSTSAKINPNGKTISSGKYGVEGVVNKSSTSTSGAKKVTGRSTISSTDTYTITVTNGGSWSYTGSGLYAHYRWFATNADGTTYSSWSHKKVK